MAGSNPPEIILELSGGSLTIKTAEAVYRVVVSEPEGGWRALPPGKPAPAALPSGEAIDDDWDSLPLPEPSHLGDSGVTPTYKPSDEDAYYREISHDMYREVGHLAKRLSSSIRDVKGVTPADLESAGEQLEHAKGQLERVVEMTEKATNRIMDLGEDIQEAANRARQIMQEVTTAAESEGGRTDDPDAQEKKQALLAALEDLSQYLGRMDDADLAAMAQEAERLRGELAAAAEAPAAEAPAPAPEPAAPALKWHFPLEVLFQTIYELCTNETVKKHIKSMWEAGGKAFDAAKVEEGLNAVAPDAADEDNFLNLPLGEVLKTLFQATGVERFQQVIKKMGATVDQIFLDQTLPLEATPNKTPPPAPKPAPAAEPAAAGPPSAAMAETQAFLERVSAALTQAAPPQLPEGLDQLVQEVLSSNEALLDSCNVVEPRLLKELEETTNSIFGSVNSIIEELSFQDLSGQTIYRIVRLLSDFQVQLLAMLVSFGTKLKTKESKREITVDESDKLAQEEVDKVLAGLTVPEEEEEAAPAEAGAEAAPKEPKEPKLNQDAVNGLLESLGF